MAKRPAEVELDGDRPLAVARLEPLRLAGRPEGPKGPDGEKEEDGPTAIYERAERALGRVHLSVTAGVLPPEAADVHIYPVGDTVLASGGVITAFEISETLRATMGKKSNDELFTGCTVVVNYDLPQSASVLVIDGVWRVIAISEYVQSPAEALAALMTSRKRAPADSEAVTLAAFARGYGYVHFGPESVLDACRGRVDKAAPLDAEALVLTIAAARRYSSSHNDSECGWLFAACSAWFMFGACTAGWMDPTRAAATLRILSTMGPVFFSYKCGLYEHRTCTDWLREASPALFDALGDRLEQCGPDRVPGGAGLDRMARRRTDEAF